MIYILVIILIWIGVYLFDLKDIPVKNGYGLFYFIGFILFCVAAFRYYNGGDTANYVNIFKSVPVFSELNEYDYSNFRFQRGYVIFVAVLKELWNNFLIQQIVTSLFINIVIFRFIRKYSPYIFLTTLFYFLLNYFEFNMEIMRECIAVAIGLLAYELISNKRYILGLLMIFFAYQFHISALILLILPFVTNIKFSKVSFFIVLGIGIILPTIYMAIPDLETYASIIFNQEDWVNDNYIKQDFSDTLNIRYYIGHLIKYAIVPFGMIWYINKRIEFRFNGLVYTYAMLQLLSMYTYAFYRFANFFAPFFWIATATFLYILIKENKKVRTIIFVAFFIVYLYLYQSVQLMWDDNKNNYFYNRYIPYNSVFVDGNYK